MKYLSLLATAICFSTALRAQHLLPVKMNNCVTERFCLDCGDVKADVDKAKFDQFLKTLNAANNTNQVGGKILFQVLLDSTGKGCVLSHSDIGKTPFAGIIATGLNDFDGYIPAVTKGVKEERTSFEMLFEFNDGKITGRVKRVEMASLVAVNSGPEIVNKTYDYRNDELPNYDITVWDNLNSNLPNNMNDHIAFDKDAQLWLSVDGGLVRFYGKKFKSENWPAGKARFYMCRGIAPDHQNTVWVLDGEALRSYSNKKWATHDSLTTGFRGGYSMHFNNATEELVVSADNGVGIYKKGKWTMITRQQVKELPSNRVAFAKRDSKNRLWIGTYSGSVMIDENGKATGFNETTSVLKGKTITSMDEDENGNLYFGLFEYDRKVKKQVNNDEGIAIMRTNGTIQQYTTSNSGMPFNHVTQVLYDKNEKVLWIATDRAGLVRYDLKNTWENYHHHNSDIPTSYIADMAFDREGTLYLATRRGLVKLKRRKAIE